MELITITVIILGAILLSILLGVYMLLIARKYSVEIPFMIIFIIGAMIFFCYMLDREEKVKRYCDYFPDEKVCIVKNTTRLSKKQREKMVQRVREEEKEMKAIIQNIEVK